MSANLTIAPKERVGPGEVVVSWQFPADGRHFARLRAASPIAGLPTDLLPDSSVRVFVDRSNTLTLSVWATEDHASRLVAEKHAVIDLVRRRYHHVLIVVTTLTIVTAWVTDSYMAAEGAIVVRTAASEFWKFATRFTGLVTTAGGAALLLSLPGASGALGRISGLDPLRNRWSFCAWIAACVAFIAFCVALFCNREVIIVRSSLAKTVECDVGVREPVWLPPGDSQLVLIDPFGKTLVGGSCQTGKGEDGRTRLDVSPHVMTLECRASVRVTGLRDSDVVRVVQPSETAPVASSGNEAIVGLRVPDCSSYPERATIELSRGGIVRASSTVPLRAQEDGSTGGELAFEDLTLQLPGPGAFDDRTGEQRFGERPGYFVKVTSTRDGDHDGGPIASEWRSWAFCAAADKECRLPARKPESDGPASAIRICLSDQAAHENLGLEEACAEHRTPLSRLVWTTSSRSDAEHSIAAVRLLRNRSGTPLPLAPMRILPTTTGQPSASSQAKARGEDESEGAPSWEWSGQRGYASHFVAPRCADAEAHYELHVGTAPAVTVSARPGPDDTSAIVLPEATARVAATATFADDARLLVLGVRSGSIECVPDRDQPGPTIERWIRDDSGAVVPPCLLLGSAVRVTGGGAGRVDIRGLPASMAGLDRDFRLVVRRTIANRTTTNHCDFNPRKARIRCAK
jgi:hypothetical protein